MVVVHTEILLQKYEIFLKSWAIRYHLRKAECMLMILEVIVIRI